MKKWIWITAPALAVGLGLVFLGGSVFAQNTGNNTAPTVNWTAMADYCRNIFTGNTTVAENDFSEMRSFCQNASATGNVGPGGMMGSGGMMGGYTANGTYGTGGMMGNRSTGRGMMSW
ncbi:MAG: hypothetical protein Q7R50_05515 [Dehalococcoidales bacterium]|nr:hypothetical protein [Dehalococcoidales bacterium]